MADAKRPDARLVTRSQFAAMMGVNPRTVTKWAEDQMPCAFHGRGGQSSRFSVPDCVKWYIAREVQARTGGGGDDISPAAELAKLNRKRTEELELRLQVRRGQLVEASAVVHEYVDLAIAVKSRIRAVPDAVADQLAGLTPQEIKRLLLAKLDDALRELARGEVLTPATDDDPDDDAPESIEARP